MLAHQSFLLLGAVLALSGCDSNPSEPVSNEGAQVAQADPAAASGVTEGPNYTIVHAPVTVAGGEQGELVLSVTPGAGFHVNLEYPWSLSLELPAVVTAPQTELGVADAAELTEDEAVYRVPVTLAGASDAAVAGDLRFSVCNETRCDVLNAQVTWAVTAAQ